MGLFCQLKGYIVFILLITTVAGCNDTVDPDIMTTTLPPTTSTILMTTLLGSTTTLPETTSQPPQAPSQPPYNTTQPQAPSQQTTQPPYHTTEPPQPTTQPPYNTTEPPQPTTQPPYHTTEPPQPTTQTPYHTTEPHQPTSQPPYYTTQPDYYTTQPPYYTTQPPHYTTQPPYYTTQPPHYTTQPPTQTTPEISSTTSAPCENDTSLPEYGDEESSSSNATTTGDEKCTDRGGVCSTDAECKGGKYVTGLCAGPANRKCCIKDDPAPVKFELVTREDWGSTVDRDDLTFLKLPVSEVIIHHTEGQEGCTTKRCKELVKNIQAGHKKRKDKNGNFWVDIGYSFLICGDGKVYEGRGWDKQGAHTPGHNKVGIAIAFIGNFDKKLPTGAALNAARALIEYGLANGKIAPDYNILGHRDASATTCPGDALYNLVKNSPKPVAPGN